MENENEVERQSEMEHVDRPEGLTRASCAEVEPMGAQILCPGLVGGVRPVHCAASEDTRGCSPASRQI